MIPSHENNIVDLPAHESMEFDVVIVGAGPAGLATAIRLKQQAAEAGADISVVVVEKGSEVGAHILSGAVIDPIGLDGLLPEWRTDPDRPLKTEVTADEFMYLGHAGGFWLPINARNCLHCKTGDIRNPNQNINWVTPDGGGPVYVNM
jgi:electron-transferring-flavoprotein dehydrogenase